MEEGHGEQWQAYGRTYSALIVGCCRSTLAENRSGGVSPPTERIDLSEDADDQRGLQRVRRLGDQRPPERGDRSRRSRGQGRQIRRQSRPQQTSQARANTFLKRTNEAMFQHSSQFPCNRHGFTVAQQRFKKDIDTDSLRPLV